jgi:hypothetical protein
MATGTESSTDVASNLRLNDNSEYKAYGSYIAAMPRLKAEGYFPMNLHDVMYRRLDLPLGHPHRIHSIEWSEKSFSTVSSVMYHPNGNIKIVKDTKCLEAITENSKLSDGSSGALIVDFNTYEDEEGREFTKTQLQNIILNKPLKEGELITHPVWGCFHSAYDYNQRLKTIAEVKLKEITSQRGFAVKRIDRMLYTHKNMNFDIPRSIEFTGSPRAPQVYPLQISEEMGDVEPLARIPFKRVVVQLHRLSQGATPSLNGPFLVGVRDRQ